MNVDSVCSSEVITVKQDQTLREAASVMRLHHVGSVVVLSAQGNSKRPLGIVTDRDLVVEVMATGLDPDTIKVSDLLDGAPVTVHQQDDVMDALHKMRSRGVRRLPVTDPHGDLAGIVSLDDLLHSVSREMSLLARVVEYQPRQEASRRR
jgi:CBS domain-containing protein